VVGVDDQRGATEVAMVGVCSGAPANLDLDDVRVPESRPDLVSPPS
jgi:hypothetical protein